MRVCLVTGIFPPDIGGPATYSEWLGERLAAFGDDVSIVTLADDPDAVNAPVRVNAIPRSLPIAARQLRTVAAIFRAARSAEVVLATGLWFEAAIASRLARRPLVTKVVGDLAWERATNRGLTADSIEDFQSSKGSFRMRLLKRYAHWPLQTAHAVIVPSRYLANLSRSFGVRPERVHVVTNAPPPTRSTGNDRRERTGGILTVARLTRWKGVQGVLEAVGSIDSATLTVAGDGPLRAELEDLSRELGLAERVRFLGSVSASRVEQLLNEARVFVLNSTYEGMPHVVLEAWQAGTPVVAAARGGTPELVQHERTGLLVPPDSPGELRDALGRVLNDDALRDRLVAGGAAALRDHSPDRTFADTRAVLARVACVPR